MIAVASMGGILAVVRWAMHGNQSAILALEIIWLSAPIWGSIGLALLLPAAIRGLFLASCVLVLPIFCYYLFRYATLSGPIANEWLISGLGIVWQILPLGIGYALSRDFHAWRAMNRQRRRAEADSAPDHVP
jgi:hypothetical protein